MKKWLGIPLAVILGFILIAGLGGYGWFYWTLKKSLPKISGETALSGIKAPVEILRDGYGIPHIYAQNEPDLYFALGYAMCQDRLWQMEFMRRLGSGQISEIFGKDFIKVDRFFRLITAGGLDNRVPGELAFIPDSFTRGINTYLKMHAKHLPIEFKLLRFKPKSWGQDDYLAILKVVSWGLSFGWRIDQVAGLILEKTGREKFKELFPGWEPDTPLIVPGKLGSLSSPSFKMVSELLAWPSVSLSGGSNNWVVSGKRSLSGKPILAKGPK